MNLESLISAVKSRAQIISHDGMTPTNTCNTLYYEYIRTKRHNDEMMPLNLIYLHINVYVQVSAMTNNLEINTDGLQITLLVLNHGRWRSLAR
jgi:hypothetical protein